MSHCSATHLAGCLAVGCRVIRSVCGVATHSFAFTTGGVARRAVAASETQTLTQHTRHSHNNHALADRAGRGAGSTVRAGRTAG